jgi:hypothetical protein
MRVAKMTTTKRIMARLRGRGRGNVFSPADFLDLGTRAAVDQALSRLARSGSIRRLARGIYDYPRIHHALGKLSPSPDALAKTLALRTQNKVQPAGAQAANSLGLSTQVPAKTTYLTTGASSKITIGNRIIVLRHASARRFVATGTRAGAVIQALDYLGKRDAPRAANILRNRVSDTDRKDLARASLKAKGWLRPLLQQIAQADNQPQRAA